MPSSPLRALVAAMDHLVGEGSADPEQRRAEMVLGFILVLTVFGGVFIAIALALLLGPHPTVWLTLATLCTNALALLLLRMVPNHVVSASVFLIGFLGGLLVIAAAGGGIGSGAVAWLIILPLVGGIVLPGGYADAFSLAVAAGLVGLYALDVWFANPWAIGELNLAVARVNLVCSLSALVVVRLTVSYNERAQARMREAMRQRDHALQEARRVEALGRMAGGVAHNYNNLLTVVASHAELIRMDGGDLESVEALEEIVRKSTGLTSQLLDYVSAATANSTVVDLSSLLRNTLSAVEAATHSNVQLVADLQEEELAVVIDEAQFGQAILALVQNANEAMPGGGTLTIAVHRGVRKGSTVAMVDVVDTGTGMTAEVLERAFDPFFTTRGLARGTGLSLASVRGLVQQYGGEVWAESVFGEGSHFRIALPLAPETNRDYRVS